MSGSYHYLAGPNEDVLGLSLGESIFQTVIWKLLLTIVPTLGRHIIPMEGNKEPLLAHLAEEPTHQRLAAGQTPIIT